MPEPVIDPEDLEEEEVELCDDCAEAPCVCPTCSDCDEVVSSVCSHCGECNDCCNCTECAHRRCDRRLDPDADNEDSCSNCSMCESHCECSTCNSCECRVESTCDNNYCDECCTCFSCDGCEEHVRRNDRSCSDCNRCVDCGCTCESNCDTDAVREGREDSEVPTTDDVVSTVTYVLEPHGEEALCPSCNSYSCHCGICYEIRDGRPQFSHKVDLWTYNLCSECNTCVNHCRADVTCAKCVAAGITSKVHSICAVCEGCAGHCACRTCDFCYLKFKEEDHCTRCNRCMTHCRCPKCKTCEAKKKTCNYCKQCLDCCTSEASECGTMGRKGGDYPIPHITPKYKCDACPPTSQWADRCLICMKCIHHCSCGNHNNISPLTFYRPINLLGFRRNTSRRELGIEIEVNSIGKLDRAKKLWDAVVKWNVSVKSDGSIGSQPGAFELNLMPSAGDVMLDELKEICDGLAKMEAKPNASCGVHVHVNASDIRNTDLTLVVDLYARVERALYDLCHPSRLSNTYSAVCGKLYKDMTTDPLGARKSLVAHLFAPDNNLRPEKAGRGGWGSQNDINKAMGNHIKDVKQNLRGTKRYRALNLASYFRRGTIEFRHMEGSANFEDISGWAMTVAAVIDSSQRLSRNQHAVLPPNSRKALLAVTPPHLHNWIIDKWTRMDTIINSNPSYKQRRSNVWGI